MWFCLQSEFNSLIASRFNVRGGPGKGKVDPCVLAYSDPMNLDGKSILRISRQRSGLGIAKITSFVSWSWLKSTPQTRKRPRRKHFWAEGTQWDAGQSYHFCPALDFVDSIPNQEPSQLVFNNTFLRIDYIRREKLDKVRPSCTQLLVFRDVNTQSGLGIKPMEYCYSMKEFMDRILCHKNISEFDTSSDISCLLFLILPFW